MVVVGIELVTAAQLTRLQLIGYLLCKRCSSVRCTKKEPQSLIGQRVKVSEETVVVHRWG